MKTERVSKLIDFKNQKNEPYAKVRKGAVSGYQMLPK